MLRTLAVNKKDWYSVYMFLALFGYNKYKYENSLKIKRLVNFL